MPHDVVGLTRCFPLPCALQMDDVYLDDKGATLNVSYSCLDAGSTRITVTFPLKVGYLEWTWVKICPASSDWSVHDVGVIGIAGIKPGGQDIPRQVTHEEQELRRPGGAAAWDPDAPPGPPMAAGPDLMPFEREWAVDERAAREAQAARLIAQERHEVEFQNDPLESHLTNEDKSFTDMRFVVVASSRKKARKLTGDVFDSKGLKTKYQRPTSAARPGEHALIDASTNRTSFFISSARSIRLAPPSILVPNEFKGRRVVIDPHVTLQAHQPTLGKGLDPVELTVDWNCRSGRGGFTPVYIILPLEPQPAGGFVQFYLTKLCAGDEDDPGRGGAGRGWNLYALIALGVMGSVMAVAYFGYGREKELRIMLGEKLAGMGVRNGRHVDILQRGAYEIVSQKDAKAGVLS